MRLIVTALCSIIASLTVWAGDIDYKAVNLYDLQGPVKECKIKTKNGYLFDGKKWVFGENGKTVGFYLYNEKGLPYLSNLTYGNHEFSFNAEYDDADRPVNITDADTFFCDVTTKYVISYDGNRRAGEEITERNGKKTTSVKLTYSGEKYDDRGNWISRIVHETKTDAKGKVKEREYPETRTIIY